MGRWLPEETKYASPGLSVSAVKMLECRFCWLLARVHGAHTFPVKQTPVHASLCVPAPSPLRV